MSDDQPPPFEPYGDAEARALRREFAKQRGPVPCPRCGRLVTVGRPIEGGGTIPPVHELTCEFCRRRAIAAG